MTILDIQLQSRWAHNKFHSFMNISLHSNGLIELKHIFLVYTQHVNIEELVFKIITKLQLSLLT